MNKLKFRLHKHQQHIRNTSPMAVRGLRGAITVNQNTAEEIASAINKLLTVLETPNQLDPAEIVSVIFSVTQDLDALFPAAVARQRPGWEQVPLLDVQHMQVSDSLDHCIRVLMGATRFCEVLKPGTYIACFRMRSQLKNQVLLTI